MLENYNQEHRPPTMIESLLEARDELSQAIKRAQHGVKSTDYELIVEWAIHLRVSRGLSPRTGRNYVHGIACFMRWLYNQQIKLDNISPNILEQWQKILYINQKELAETRNGKLTAVRQFYNWREQMGFGINPVRSYSGPSREQRIPRKFSKEQLQRILGACDLSTIKGRRDYAVVLFFLSTGARRSEVASLKLSQLNLSTHVGGVIITGKGQKERNVAFEGPVVKALQQWLFDRESIRLTNNDAVFVSLRGRYTGGPLGAQGLNNLLKALFKKAKLKIPSGMALHTLRSTFATALYDADFGLEEVRLLLGHNSINTTRKYIALSRRQMQVRLPGSFFRDIV